MATHHMCISLIHARSRSATRIEALATATQFEAQLIERGHDRPVATMMAAQLYADIIHGNRETGKEATA